MAVYNYVRQRPGDWLKFVEEGRYSMENSVVAAGQGALLSGTVMVLTGGKLTPMLTTGGANVIGILFDDVPASTVDVPAAYVARHAVVADKCLIWAAGVLTGDKTAAYAKLETLGIQVREAA